MKKALAILLAVALVGVAFAQDAAPAPVAQLVKFEVPVLTFGVTGSYEFTAIAEKTVVSLKNMDGDLANASVYKNGGSKFAIEPWAQWVAGNYTFKYTNGYKYDTGDDTPGVMTLNKFMVKYVNGGLTISDTFTWDQGDYRDVSDTANKNRPFDNTFDIKMVQDNVSAYVKYRLGESVTTLSTSNGAEPTGEVLDYINLLGKNGNLKNAWFEISKIFDVLTIRVGDTDGWDLRLASLLDTNAYTSSNEDIGYYCMGGFTTSIGTLYTFDLSAMVPLTLKVASIVPFPSTQSLFTDWIGGRNMAFNGTYEMKDVATINVGFGPSLDYVANQYEDGTTEAAFAGDHLYGTFNKPNASAYNAFVAYFTDSDSAASGDLAVALTDELKTTCTNEFWLDAKVVAVPNLVLQVGLGGQMGSYVDLDKVNTALTDGDWGFVADYDPVAVGAQPGYFFNELKLTAVPYSVYNFAAEVTYDLKDVVAGLTFEGETFVNMGSGANGLKAYGVRFSDAKADLKDIDTNYVAASFTEGNAMNDEFYDINPFILRLKAAYAIDDKISVYGQNKYSAQEGSFTGDDFIVNGVTAYGYYGKDKVSLGTDLTAGKGTINVEFGYSVFTGLPTAANMTPDGADTANSKAAYNEFVSSTYCPWSLAITYGVSF